MQNRHRQLAGTLLMFVLIVSQLYPLLISAATDSDLQAKIDESKSKIEKLEREAAQYQSALVQIGTDKKTLQNAIYSLDTTKKKLDTDISITEESISITEDQIGELNSKIAAKTKSIQDGKEAIGQDLRIMNEMGDTSIVEVFLSGASFSEIWNYNQQLQTISMTLRDKVNLLRRDVVDLTTAKNEAETKSTELSGQKDLLSLQQQSVRTQQQEKNSLLANTKNQESEYQKILAKNREEVAKFEAELFEYERQLNPDFNRGSYPAPSNGILKWPLDSIRITQLFGKTADSGRLYSSGSHNGMDLAVNVGTPVKSVLDGIVVGTGNTDLQKGCYSFGQWVYVRHNNGLGTIYAHLSAIKVSKGDHVKTGDVLGLSGNTGYSTGPHLHLGLYADDGVTIAQYSNSINCKNVVIPLANIEAYLDPGAYLPKI